MIKSNCLFLFLVFLQPIKVAYSQTSVAEQPVENNAASEPEKNLSTDGISVDNDASLDVIPPEIPTIVRDPFEPPEGVFKEPEPEKIQAPIVVKSSNPYEKFSVSEYSIVGIFLGQSQKAFLKTPEQQIIKVAPGYRLGSEGGVVWKIRPRDVLVVIPNAQDGRQSQVFTIKFRR